MKGATLAHADLERDPSTERRLVPEHGCQIWVFGDWRAGVALKTAGGEHTFHVLCLEHNNTTAKMRGEKEADKREAHEAKT